MSGLEAHNRVRAGAPACTLHAFLPSQGRVIALHHVNERLGNTLQ